MIEVKTNGKLYIAGEYQVLEPKGNAIIYGLKRGITIRIQKSDVFYYVTKYKHIKFYYKDSKLSFTKHNKILNKTLEMVFEYLKYKNVKITPFSLMILTDLSSKEGLKYGFGSSSAIVTGLIKAILSHYGLNASNELIFRLGVLSQIRANDLTSGGDLASTLIEGFIYYERYNLAYVLANKDNIKILEEPWPDLVIEKLDGVDIKVIAAWTKRSYKTKPLDKELAASHFNDANKIVKSLKYNLLNNNYLEVKKDINNYNFLLKTILKGTNRYLDKYDVLNELTSSYDLVSKLSGAGGGDSSIILYEKDYPITTIKEAVEAIHFKLIDV